MVTHPSPGPCGKLHALWVSAWGLAASLHPCFSDGPVGNVCTRDSASMAKTCTAWYLLVPGMSGHRGPVRYSQRPSDLRREERLAEVRLSVLSRQPFLSTPKAFLLNSGTEAAVPCSLHIRPGDPCPVSAEGECGQDWLQRPRPCLHKSLCLLDPFPLLQEGVA